MTLPAWPEIVGYLAACLLMLTFFMRQMVPLRAVALASSAAWLTYGTADHIYPIVALHLVLIPLNGFRLFQSLRDRTAAPRVVPNRAPSGGRAEVQVYSSTPVGPDAKKSLAAGGRR